MSKTSSFEFATATRIIFGTGKVSEAAEIAAGLGSHALIVSSGSSKNTGGQIAEQLHKLGRSITQYSISGEPDVETVEKGAAIARESECDLVIGIGGGSAIDTGKAIATLLTNPGNVLDYVEVVGHGQAITQPAAPYIAIPTTAGTGAEVTRNAVIAVPEKSVKVSMRSAYMLPRVALIDPKLTFTMPPEITASTGLDALTQLIEGYTSNRANPMTDAIAIHGITRATKSLAIAYHENKPEAHEDMAYASLCSGIVLANAGLGAIHGFAAVLGGRYAIPHGICCAALLPYVVEANIRTLSARKPEHPSMAKYTEIASLIKGKQFLLFKLPKQLAELCADLNIPRLSTYGVVTHDIPEIIAQAQQSSSMKANPIALTPEELEQVLLAAI